MSSWAARARLHLSQKGQEGTDETDKTPLSSVLSVRVGAFCEKRESANDGELTPKEGEQVSTPTGGTIRPAGLSAKLLAASLALDAQIQAAGLLPGNGAEHGYDPTPTATTGRETDTHAARVIRFTGKGVTPTDGEALADKLATRDRESDDRRLCLECSHLAGHAGSWRCRGWQRAGIALQARDAGLPGDLVRTLQRCDAFTLAQEVQLPHQAP